LVRQTFIRLHREGSGPMFVLAGQLVNLASGVTGN
jgi:hypothetical protein